MTSDRTTNHTDGAIVTDAAGDDRYVVISADGHAGADLRDYRDYLAPSWHAEFDDWAAVYEIPYEDMKGADADRNWNSGRRIQELEADGQVAEVIFPNTVPPFFPRPSLVGQPPAVTAADQQRRWAGLQAHNRWMVDFCADAPGRRAGIAQITLHDIDATVAEIRWAHDAGLRGGVLLPGTPPGSGLPQIYDPYYDPLWHVCAELGMPVNQHGGSAAPPMGSTDVDNVVFMLEAAWWSHRALTHLIIGGVLERFPELCVVFTEQGTGWVPGELMKLEYFFDRMRDAQGSQEREWGLTVVERLSLRPTDYWNRQCHVGASFLRRGEVEVRASVGIDKVMWGCDYPHREATYPYSSYALRNAFSGLPPSEVASMVGGNAAALYGFDLAVLAPLAAEVGPRVSDIAAPIAPGELPAGAQKCPAFAG